MTSESKILAPFDKATQIWLSSVDKAARGEAQRVSQRLREAELAGEPVELDADEQGIMALIQALGVLYNRAIMAGWVQDVYLTPEMQSKEGEIEQEPVFRGLERDTIK